MRRLHQCSWSSGIRSGTRLLYAQERPVFRVKVDMVVLGFTVTDSQRSIRNGPEA